MEQNAGNFTLSFQQVLGTNQLVRHGRSIDPLGKRLRTVTQEQYEFRMAHPNANAPVPKVWDFRLNPQGMIVPELSTGLSTFTSVANFPQGFQKTPKRLWKLQSMTSYGEIQIAQLYPNEIHFNAINMNHFGIRPVNPVRPETFRQMLQCLPWLKMH